MASPTTPPDRKTFSTGFSTGTRVSSLMRRRIFEHRRFWPDYRVVDDELFVVRVLADGGRFAYYDDPHVVYRVHEDNSSGSASGCSRCCTSGSSGGTGRPHGR